MSRCRNVSTKIPSALLHELGSRGDQRELNVGRTRVWEVITRNWRDLHREGLGDAPPGSLSIQNLPAILSPRLARHHCYYDGLRVVRPRIPAPSIYTLLLSTVYAKHISHPHSSLVLVNMLLSFKHSTTAPGILMSLLYSPLMHRNIALIKK